MKTIQIQDKTFEISIPEETISENIKTMADKMNADLQGKDVVFIGVLNGVFMFFSDLMKNISFDCSINFVKVASYQGTKSTGRIKQLIGLQSNIKDKTIVVVEDIIDSGFTMKQIVKQIKQFNPKEIQIATLLFKPDACNVDISIDYSAFHIANDFVVGYGLDYNQHGRNLRSIYKLVSPVK